MLQTSPESADIAIAILATPKVVPTSHLSIWQSGSGLASAVLFALRDCSYAMSRESLALLFTDHRNFDARARIPLLMLEMDYANIDAGYSRVLVYGKVDFGI